MDHISVPVRDATRTRAFYRAVLEPLGWRAAGYREGVYVAFKKSGTVALYFHRAEVCGAVHLAFRADSELAVEAFHTAAIAAGGTDNGAPGPRPSYGSGYYAAFVRDPDGHNVEAVRGGVGG